MNLYDLYTAPSRVAGILNIKAVPSSLRVIDCKSGPWTDVVITCQVKISPNEFPQLLAGYRYKEESAEGTSHNYWDEVGFPFLLNTKFTTRPIAFKNGGSITIAADTLRENVLVHLYIE
jgi:hypothetical protein